MGGGPCRAIGPSDTGTRDQGLEQLEDENGKLKRLVANLSLDKEMLQEALRKKF